MASASFMGSGAKGPCEQRKELTWLSRLGKLWLESPEHSLRDESQFSRWAVRKAVSGGWVAGWKQSSGPVWTHWRITQRSTGQERSAPEKEWKGRNVDRWWGSDPVRRVRHYPVGSTAIGVLLPQECLNLFLERILTIFFLHVEHGCAALETLVAGRSTMRLL